MKPSSMKTKSIEIDPSVQTLIVISDIHAYHDPLLALDLELGKLTHPYMLFVNGDLFEGGIDAADTVDWVHTHAAGHITRGNHESHLDEFDADMDHGRHPPNLEMAQYAMLTDWQLQFVRDLPDELLLRWRGKSIRLIHGHIDLAGQSVSYMTEPQQLIERLHDRTVDLAAIAHTHYPFAIDLNGHWLANSGSVAVPIVQFRDPQGQMIRHSKCDPWGNGDDPRSSYLAITEDRGALDVKICRFDYDRRSLLARYDRCDAIAASMDYRRAWILHGVHDPLLLCPSGRD